MGLTWYTWLEQAGPIPASAPIIDALARALRLDADQHRHLRILANLPPPGPQPGPAEVLPRLRRLVEAAAPAPAAVYDVHYDYLAWNAPYVRVRHDPAAAAEDRRNLLWMLLTDLHIRARMPRWEPAARAVLCRFRAAAGQRPDDPRFTELVGALTDASPEFRQWWADHPVREFRPATSSIRSNTPTSSWSCSCPPAATTAGASSHCSAERGRPPGSIGVSWWMSWRLRRSAMAAWSGPRASSSASSPR